MTPCEVGGWGRSVGTPTTSDGPESITRWVIMTRDREDPDGVWVQFGLPWIVEGDYQQGRIDGFLEGLRELGHRNNIEFKMAPLAEVEESCG